jgi:hypothetical protein
MSAFVGIAYMNQAKKLFLFAIFPLFYCRLCHMRHVLCTVELPD